MESGQLGLPKCMRAQKPPCPYDFEACLELAEDEAMWDYLQVGLDLLEMCLTETEYVTATQTADAVALIAQGADMHTKSSDGWTLLHQAYDNGLAKIAIGAAREGRGRARQGHS